MEEALIDTDILSFYFKGNKKIAKKIEKYLEEFECLNISIITYYEILSGLKFKDAKKQLNLFRLFAKENKVLPITEHSIEISSEIYSQTRKLGNPLDDIDLLIAGIALANKMTLVTNNEKHFLKIRNLPVQNWNK